MPRPLSRPATATVVPMRKLYVYLVVLALLAVGCKVRIEQGTTVREDGSGEVTIVVLLDEELRELVGFEDAESTFELAGGVPDGFQVSNVRDGEFEGARAVRPFESLDELATVIDDILAGTEIAEELALTRTGNQFDYRATVGDIQQIAASANLPGVTAETFDEFFEISLSLVLPGDLLEHNADEVSPDGRLTWQIQGDDTGRTLSASSRVANPLLPWALAIAAALAAVGGSIAWWRVRRQERDDPAA